MLAKVCAAAVQGIEAYPVEVEVNVGWGDTNVIIVGLPDAAVKESRDRVSTAMTNSAFKFPMGRTTINLAPGIRPCTRARARMTPATPFHGVRRATLTSKGQTTIPKKIRDSLAMKAGDRMTFTLMPDATVVMRVKTKSVTDLAGVLHKKGRKPVPVEQLSR